MEKDKFWKKRENRSVLRAKTRSGVLTGRDKSSEDAKKKKKDKSKETKPKDETKTKGPDINKKESKKDKIKAEKEPAKKGGGDGDIDTEAKETPANATVTPSAALGKSGTIKTLKTEKESSKKSDNVKKDQKSKTANVRDEDEKRGKRVKTFPDESAPSKSGKGKKDKTSKSVSQGRQEKPSSETTEVSDLPSDLDGQNTFRTETDLVTEDVVSDLEEEEQSFVADHHVNVQAELVRAQEKPGPGILKKTTPSNEPDRKKSDMEESKPTVTESKPRELFVSIRGWAGEEADDLSFPPGCVLTVLQRKYIQFPPLKVDRRNKVQKAFADYFQMEDEEESKERLDDKKATDDNRQKVNTEDEAKKTTDRKERERITREAFTEVFQLEDAEPEISFKQPLPAKTVAKAPTRKPEDSDTTDMVGSMYDEDTFTLDDLVEDNLTETKGIKQNAAPRQPAEEKNEGVIEAGRAVSVKERVSQWEKITTGKPEKRASQKAQNSVKFKPQGGVSNEPSKGDDEEQEEDDNDKVDDDDDDDMLGNEEELMKAHPEDELTNRKAHAMEKDEETDDEETDDEEISELSEEELENMDDFKDQPVHSVPPKKNELLNSAAKWLYQSNAKLLKSLEPLPQGARISTLASLDWTKYSYQTFLVPRLGSSHLMLVDLVYDAGERKVKT
ncbi:unnamed protein product [Echinostoma caproni]|uniref:EOG090X0F73 n=1 Tax=Echinostoma caproni TaxID=27848 RepID=A0A183ATV4_9TREM|nr:unnamed protein product [Echinostoma caproni]